METKIGKQGRLKYGIRLRLIAILLLAGLVPMLIASLTGALYTVSALKQSIGANFVQIATGGANEIETTLAKEIESARRLALSSFVLREEVEKANARYEGRDVSEILSEIGEMDRKWVHASEGDEFILQTINSRASLRIKSYQTTADIFSEIMVTDVRGALVGATGRTSDYYQADEQWWQEAFNGGKGAVYLSPLHYDESAGVVSLDVCVPLMNEKRDRVIGVLKIEMDATQLLKSVSEIRVGETGNAMLVSSGGAVMVDGGRIMPAEQVPEEMTARLDPSRTTWYVGRGVDTTGNRGEDGIIAIAPLKLPNDISPGSMGGEQWFFIVRQNAREAYSPVRDLAATLSLIGGGILAAIIFVGVWFASRISRPVKVLCRGAELLGAGRLDHRLNIRTGDEIEQLAEEFNRMAEKLDAAHGSLERKVAERTAELNAAKTFSENIIETARSVLITLDCEGKIKTFNSYAEILTGYDRGEVLGRNWFEIFIPNSDRQKANSVFEDCLRGNLINNVENPIICRNGEEKIILWNNSILRDENGNVMGILSAGSDITERKRAEEEIRLARERAEAAGKELGETIKELEQFNRLAVGREMRIIELKQQINALCEKLGEMPRYDLSCPQEGFAESRS